MNEVLARAAQENASEDELRALIDGLVEVTADADPELVSRVAWFHVLHAETAAQLALVERIGELGVAGDWIGDLFNLLTHRADAVCALVRGAVSGGHESSLAPLVSTWVRKALTPETLEKAARDGGRFTETAGIERAAERFASTVLLLPAGDLRAAALAAMEEALSGDSSWAAGAFELNVREILKNA